MILKHFFCFDYMLDVADEPLSEEYVKKFHNLLKINTSAAKQSWFRVGDYKLRPNIVGGKETSLPLDVPADMAHLIETYRNKQVDDHKFFYDSGLTEYHRLKDYLIDTCLSAQDDYKKMTAYFFPSWKNDH